MISEGPTVFLGSPTWDCNGVRFSVWWGPEVLSEPRSEAPGWGSSRDPFPAEWYLCHPKGILHSLGSEYPYARLGHYNKIANYRNKIIWDWCSVWWFLSVIGVPACSGLTTAPGTLCVVTFRLLSFSEVLEMDYLETCMPHVKRQLLPVQCPLCFWNMQTDLKSLNERCWFEMVRWQWRHLWNLGTETCKHQHLTIDLVYFRLEVPLCIRHHAEHFYFKIIWGHILN